MTDLRDLPAPAAVIFDLDGTLVDTVKTRINAWLTTFDEDGIPADRGQVASLIGADGKKLAREVAERAGRRLSDADADRIDKRAGAIYDELNTHPKPTAGAHSLLVAIEHSSLAWAIATSSLPEQTVVSIDALDLPQKPLLVDGSHVKHAKPAPDLLLQAAQKLKTAPAECWYVGDSVWDMSAARSAGMIAVGVAYGAATEQDLLAAGAGAVTNLANVETELRQRVLLE